MQHVQRRRAAILAAAAFSTLTINSAFADTRTWSGTTSTSWTVAENWNGTAPVATDSLFFPGSTSNRTMVNDFPLNTQFNGLSFSGQGYIIANTGNGFSLMGNVVSNAGSSNGGNAINVPVTLLQATEITVNGTYRVEFNGGLFGNFGVTKSGDGAARLSGVASTYTGDTTISNGPLELISTTDLLPFGAGKGNVFVDSTGILRLNNANTNINALNGTGLVEKTNSGSRTLTVGNNDANGTFSGNFTSTGGSSGLVKTGLGSQTFGNVTLPGTISANAGKLLINGTATAPTMTTAANATSGGTGTMVISGVYTVNGSVAPGVNNTGDLHVSAATATFSATGGLLTELGGKTVGDGTGNYDQLNFTNAAGTVAVDAASTIGVSLVNNFVPSNSDIFYVLTRADTGAFSTLFNGTTEGGTVTFAGGLYQGQITYLANWTGTQGGSTLTGGNDVAIYNVQPVPEPTSIALLGLGTLALAGRRRRQAK